MLLKGDLGNYVSAIDTRVFRGFCIADEVAPFVVINDQDARTAWTFTLLHETVHLLLGHTGVSGAYTESEVERFCDDVAGEFLLPGDEMDELRQLVGGGNRGMSAGIEVHQYFCRESKIEPNPGCLQGLQGLPDRPRDVQGTEQSLSRIVAC